MSDVTNSPTDLPTPPLREDLRLSEGGPGPQGEPSWVIQDTVINRFYRIGWLEFECLLRWGQSPQRISDQIAQQTALKPDPQQVLAFGRFLAHHQLIRPGPEAAARMGGRGGASGWFSWRWWLHHYLFFRIPLLRPQVLLARIVRHIGWLFHPLTAWLVIGLGLTGIVMVLHQWDTFATAVVESFSAEGLISFALALIVAKTLHELGHALVATRLGLRVAHMGIAFVVMWPMLYTDTGESWKLRSARQRLAIASAGILTELALAGLATLGWALSDPGPLRNALLYLATTSWALSLALNASPFMRFDGYFILSDLLDFPNLHERASAMARVALRRSVLGLPDPWPEAFSPGRRRALVGFAMLTWCYRLVLFLGIAVAVYLFFFKLLGIVLFAVEVSWFVVMPVWRELRQWWARRREVAPGRRFGLLAFLLVLLLVLALPWRTQVHAMGVARAEKQLRVYAPYPALLQEIRRGGEAQQGDTLAVLDEPDIAARNRGNEASIRGYQERLAGLMADPDGQAQEVATRQRLNVQFEQARAARSEMARLKLQAPFAGLWMDVNPDWQAGQWIGSRELIGVLVDPSRWQVDAYVKQDEVQRLDVGMAVRFYPEGQPTPIAGRVAAIASTRVSQLEHPILSSRFGGPLATAPHGDALVPTPALFQVLVQLDAPPPSLRETRGHVQIEATRRSLLADWLTRTYAVLVRESGF